MNRGAGGGAGHSMWMPIGDDHKGGCRWILLQKQVRNV